MEDFYSFTGPVRLLIVERVLIQETLFSYKENSRKILTQLIINENGKIATELTESSSIEYIYNSGNNLTHKKVKDKNGEVIDQTVFIYSGTNLIQEERISPDGINREIKKYKYNDTGLLFSEKSGSRYITYKYNDSGCLEKECRFFGKKPELVLFYKYDDLKEIIEIKTVNSYGRQIRLEKFKWENGLLVSEFCLNENGVILKDDIFEYSCFHDGNWLKKERFSSVSNENRIPIDIIYRSITYTDNYPKISPIEEGNYEICKSNNSSISFTDGSKYTGSLLNGKMEGKGFIQWPDGSSYKGDFNNNMMDGKGVLKWQNGDIYSGSFIKGKMKGVGRLSWKNGETFFGLFENNCRTNQGIIEEE